MGEKKGMSGEREEKRRAKETEIPREETRDFENLRSPLATTTAATKAVATLRLIKYLVTVRRNKCQAIREFVNREHSREPELPADSTSNR